MITRTCIEISNRARVIFTQNTPKVLKPTFRRQIVISGIAQLFSGILCFIFIFVHRRRTENDQILILPIPTELGYRWMTFFLIIAVFGALWVSKKAQHLYCETLTLNVTSPSCVCVCVKKIEIC